jgi:hypothetical protein
VGEILRRIFMATPVGIEQSLAKILLESHVKIVVLLLLRKHIWEEVFIIALPARFYKNQKS